MKIFIETQRLLLREIVEDDAQDFFELDSNPEVHKYLGNKPVTHIEESENMIKDIRKQYEDNGIGRWAIIEKETNHFIGWSGLKYETMIRTEFNYYDLGYRLKKKYWGKGIATETAMASLKYGFKELNLPEICAAAEIEHIASNRILQKIGMKFIEVFKYDGSLINWYKIKKSDWHFHIQDENAT